MVSEATKMAICRWQMDTKDIVEVIEHHRPISHSPCRRRSIGPLPSCCYSTSTLCLPIEVGKDWNDTEGKHIAKKIVAIRPLSSV